VRIMQNADGYGTSGVCMSELTFDIPASDYGFHDIPPAAKVTFHMVGAGDVPVTIAPAFYIYSRSKSGAVISFKCYDRMIWTEQPDAISESSFDDNGLIESQWAVQQIASQCGFNGWGLGGTVTTVPEVYMPKEDIIGKGCHDILNAVSEAWCGFFKVGNDDKLIFIPFGSVYSLGNQAYRHTSVSTGGVKGPIMRVIMSNGSETFSAGNSGADVFNTLKLSSKYASGDIAAQIMERVRDYVYEAWECRKCIINDSACGIEINAAIAFGDGSERVANHITKIVTPAGILLSCGSNDVTETEFDFLGALSRKIEERIADGEKLGAKIKGGKVQISRYEGFEYIVDAEEKSQNKSKAASDGAIDIKPEKKFGVSEVTSDGIVKVDYAVDEKTKPKIEVNADLSGFSTTYGNTVIQYELEWDGDNVTLKDPPKEE